MADETTRAPAPVRSGVGFLRRTLANALVAAGLGGVAYWGHHTDWTFTPTRPAASAPVPPEGLGRVHLGGALPGASALQREVTIEFDSTAAVDTLGIGIAPVWPGAISDTVAAPGEVGFDPALVTRVAPRAAGVVWRVNKRAGDSVATGEVLALVDAADAGKAKADFLQALAQSRLRAKTLAARKTAAKIVSAQAIREAEADLAEAETRLQTATQALANLDLAVKADDFRELPLETVAAQLRQVGVSGVSADGANLIPVRAPFAGVVLSADVVAGESADPVKPLFVIADPRRVWVTLHVRTADAGRVAVGQTIRFRTDGSTEDVACRVELVGRAADESTRTIPVRASVANDRGQLRAGTLGQGVVVLRHEPKALLVPHDAIQQFRGAPVVFVRDRNYLKADGPKAFRARPVTVGTRDAENTEIVAGLSAGDVVATKGAGLLLNELTRAIDGPSAEVRTP